jgi:phosphoserine phosphatase
MKSGRAIGLSIALGVCGFASGAKQGCSIPGTATLAKSPSAVAEAPDALPSWNEGPSKQAIRDFVAQVTNKHGPDFVPVEERVAVFDNDGTLWPERPVPAQLLFAVDRVKALAPEHPEWRGKQPFKAALESDLAALSETGERQVAELIMATHAGNTADEFAGVVRSWIATARDERFDQPYTSLAYKPMLEVMSYLRASGFKTFVVTGGGVEFVRAFSSDVYGVPPEQVIGSRTKQRYEVRNGRPVVVRLPEIDAIDDKAGKPTAIEEAIGRRPIAAFGNSDGDFEMLEWTTSQRGRTLGVLIQHTDAEREWKYDRDARESTLSRGLDEAAARHWVVTDMKSEWKVVFAPP